MLTKAQYSLLFNWMAVTYMPAVGTVNVKLYGLAQHPFEPAVMYAAPDAGMRRITRPSSTDPATVYVPMSHQKPLLRMYQEQYSQFKFMPPQLSLQEQQDGPTPADMLVGIFAPMPLQLQLL